MIMANVLKVFTHFKPLLSQVLKMFSFIIKSGICVLPTLCTSLFFMRQNLQNKFFQFYC